MKDSAFNHKKYLQWKENNPDSYARQQVKMRERYRELRRLAYEKMGNECVECHTKDTRVLNLDHVNDDGKEHRSTGAGKLTRVYKSIVDGNCEYELQLLCANCHAIKTWNRDTRE